MALLLTPGLSLALSAAGETPSAAATDFSTGFQKLVTLGLPPLEDAEWINAGDGARESGDYELMEILGELKGNGWKIQAQGKPAFLPLGAVTARDLPASASGGSGLLGALLGGGKKPAKSADAAKDAAKLSSLLANEDKSKELRQGFEYRGQGSLGKLLIFAAQLHQSGHPAEANQLASAVFSISPNPEAVVDAAVDRLAGRDLDRVTETFFRGHDWATYERDLRSLVERYPRGWENLPAVQMLLPAVARRAAGEKPPKPELNGIPLHPDAIAALEGLLQETKGKPDDDAVTRYAKERGIPTKMLTPETRAQIASMLADGDDGSSSGPWLIEEPPEKDGGDPISRLKNLGLDALPALAAVATDDTLTFSPNSSSSRTSYSYSSRRESAEARALSAYKSMARPISRGEIALGLLAATLPGEDIDTESPQALADTAVEFWKAHRGKSSLDLTLVFLAEGDSSQKHIAGTSLAGMKDPAAHQAFEKHILESDDPLPYLDSVETYLKVRKGAAKDFFNRFSPKFKEHLDGVDLDQVGGGYTIKQAGGIDKYLKKLSLLVGSDSPRKLLMKLAKAKKTDTAQINSVAEAMEGSKDYLEAFLEAAGAATSESTRVALLNHLHRYSPADGDEDAGDEESSEEAPPEEIPVPPALVSHWTALLDDERPTKDGPKIQILVASLMESIYSTGGDDSRQLYSFDPSAFEKLLLDRSRDRLAGKPPRPMPAAGQVPADRLKGLLEQVAAAEPDAIHAMVQGWPLEEKAAFAQWQVDSENLEKIPKSLVAARKILAPPMDYPGGSPPARILEILGSLELKPGTGLNAESMVALATKLAPDAEARSGLSLAFGLSPLGTGLLSQADRAFAGNDKEPVSRRALYMLSNAQSALRGAEGEPDAVVLITWITPGSGSRDTRALWSLKDKTVTPPGEEALRKFREAMETMDKPEAFRFSWMLQVLARKDTGKLEEAFRPPAEEESTEEAGEESTEE